MLFPHYSSLLFKNTLPRGATTFSEGLSCALGWVRWQQLEQVMSSPGQPQPPLTAPPTAASAQYKTGPYTGERRCHRCDL